MDVTAGQSVARVDAATATRGSRAGRGERGGAAVWLMGMALVVCLVMIALLVGVIVARGVATFWPRRMDLVTLRAEPGGETFLGVRVRDEAYDATPTDEAQLEALASAGVDTGEFVDDKGRPIRRYYRVANRDLGQDGFRWVPLFEMEGEPRRPEDAVVLERRDWGDWHGFVRAIVIDTRLPATAELFQDRPVSTEYGEGTATRTLERPRRGDPFVLERVTVAVEASEAESVLRGLLRDARSRLAEIRRIEREERVPLDRALSRLALRVKRAEIALARRDAGARGIGWGAWSALAAGTALCGIAFVVLLRRPVERRSTVAGRVVVCGAAAGALALGAGAVLERPWADGGMTVERLEALRADVHEESERIAAEASAIDARLDALRSEDARYRVIVDEPRTGRFAPADSSSPQDPLPVSSIVRATWLNRLGWGERVGLYLDRTWEFLSSDPRNANQEGGVFPVIVGTVTLTLLLTVAVVPLGVIAAIYLREYAKQGPLTSLIRIAVNNLAGVPSIVYGVFGLGFFCYTLGAWVDSGPEAPLARTNWWMLVGGLVLAVLGAVACAAAASQGKRRARAGRLTAGVLWVSALGLAVLLVARAPYFHGLFEARAAMNSPTFGGRGILWAALTLALLTLPVVIVATEEAIAAVPRSLREGSYGCGAGKWQTIRRIVLPGALPGIMTGGILAISRGAGEVAPLMLVGAVKVAPQLPIDGQAPFVHPERSFMHLGFHIFDLGLQSKDAEAARPLVWTTTLLLILIVLSLNLVAVILRARLRGQRSAGL